MSFRRAGVVSFIIVLAAAIRCGADVTITQELGIGTTWLDVRPFWSPVYGWGDYYGDAAACGGRLTSVASGQYQVDYYLAWVKNLREGDILHFTGTGCPSRFSYFWTYAADAIVHNQPCTLYAPVTSPQIDERTLTVPAGALGVVVCETNAGSGRISNIVDWFTLVVPAHAEVILPDRVVMPEFPGPSILDVPADQGGVVDIGWTANAYDAPLASTPITEYAVQESLGSWQTIATIAAARTSTYLVTLPTANVLTAGDPAHYSRYRIVARTAAPELFFESRVDSGYSVDNLAPAAPTLSLTDTENSRTLVWMNSNVTDLGVTCLYRGNTPGFESGEPVVCTSSQFWYLETHLARYYYRARAFDIHGNASEWSNEVIGRWPTAVPDALPSILKLYPCHPNPFNPRTTIKYDLPESGHVRLTVFDVAGRLVCRLVDENMTHGRHEAVWDGRDGSGREVGSGSYLARLEFGSKVDAVRLGLVR